MTMTSLTIKDIETALEEIYKCASKAIQTGNRSDFEAASKKLCHLEERLLAERDRR